MSEQEFLNKGFEALKTGKKRTAFKLFEKAHEQGNVEATFQLACLLAQKGKKNHGILHGLKLVLTEGVDGDREKAKSYFWEASRRGHILAFSRRVITEKALSGYYRYQDLLDLIESIPNDKERAYLLALKVVREYDYSSDDGASCSWEFYVRAADLGHAESQFIVGKKLATSSREGSYNAKQDPVYFNFPQAEKYLSMAAKNGHIESHLLLINLYTQNKWEDPTYNKIEDTFASLSRLVTRESKSDIKEIYTKAAKAMSDFFSGEKDDERSQKYNIGSDSFPGDEELARTQAEEAEAQARFEEAEARARAEQKEVELAEIERQISSRTPEENLAYGLELKSEGKHAQALPHLLAAASQGIAEAEMEVGLMYLISELEDKKSAIDWFRKASDKNFLPAQISLLSLYNKESDPVPFFKCFDAVVKRDDQDMKSLYPHVKANLINMLAKNGFYDQMFRYLELFMKVEDDFRASAEHMNAYYKQNQRSLVSREAGVPFEEAEGSAQTEAPPLPRPKKKEPIKIEKLSENTISRFEKFGKFLTSTDNFAGREKEIRSIIRALKKEKKPNALLIGEAGVGKTALVEQVARQLSSEGRFVFNLDVPSLISGTMWRGDFEKNIQELISLAEQYKDTVVIFADEFHMLMGAGRVVDSSMDVSNMLKQALSRGTISMIGATTPDELKKYVQQDGAMLRRFQIVRVPEPNKEETLTMLYAGAPKLTERGIVPAVGVFEKIYDMSKRYLPNRNMPDVVFDIMENAAELIEEERNSLTLDENVVARVISDMSGVPSQDMLNENSGRILDLAPFLKSNLVGQDEAIDQFSQHMMNVWAGLGDPNKGVRAAFLFSGPTGVGKTETVTLLSDFLGIKLVTVNMSEYMEKHAVSRLIGAPPGYHGHDKGGILTEAVDKAPFSIVLLDEVEKAHPDIFNIFLQVLDKGLMQDGSGRTIDFRNTIIVLTTNAGQADIKNGIGFGAGRNEDAPGIAIEQFFSPEFRARLDGVVDYSRLSFKEAKSIAKLFLEKASEGLRQSRSIKVEFDESVLSAAAQGGFNALEGARPMKKYIRDSVMSVLTMPLLEKRIGNGDKLKIAFNIEKAGYEWTQIEEQISDTSVSEPKPS